MKIGVVPYINALPLLYGISYEYLSCTPQELVVKMRNAELDLAILPILEVLQNPDDYYVLPNMAIGSVGKTASVKIVLRSDLSKVKRVGLDKNSMISNTLARIVLKYAYKIEPKYIEDSSLRDFEVNRGLNAQVVIGDSALFHQGDALDLGEEWEKMTGLPFVYAMWVARRSVDVSDIYPKLLRAKNEGLTNIDVIIASILNPDKDLLSNYFTNCLCYDLGDKQSQGIKKFYNYLKRLKLVKGDFSFPVLDVGE